MDDDRARLRLIIEGRVQGVWFRASAAEQAQASGVTGYARNRPDGAVEIVAEGSRKKLESLRLWARTGPPLAHVSTITEEWAQFKGDFDCFRVC
ncbi:MAG: acylphosphatase [Candidatus Binataceae bacterium]|nr:acylphosphatase [Candidatus Binataceae bacterium]